MKQGIFKPFLRFSSRSLNNIGACPVENSREASEENLNEKRYLNLPEELREAHEKVVNVILELDSEPVEDWKEIENSDGVRGWCKEKTQDNNEEEIPIIKSECMLPYHFSQVLSFVWDIDNQYIIHPDLERMHFPISHNDRTSLNYRVTKPTWPFQSRQVCNLGGFRVHNGEKIIFYGSSCDFAKNMFSKFVSEELPFTEFDFSGIILEPEGDETRVRRITQVRTNGTFAHFFADLMKKKSVHTLSQFRESLKKYSTVVPENHTLQGRDDGIYLDEDAMLKEFSTWRVSENPSEDANLGILVEDAAAAYGTAKEVEKPETDDETDEDSFEERSLLGAVESSKPTNTVIESQGLEMEEVSIVTVDAPRSFAGMCTGVLCVCK